MMLNDEHTRARCDLCGTEFDCDDDLHDVGDGRDLCGVCFDTEQEKLRSACGLCGSVSLTDLGHGHGDGTVICNACGAHWWKRWYTRKEWEAWINEPNRE